MTTRTHTVTVIRAAIEGDELAVVVSVDPFGPNPSAHLQRYKLGAAGVALLSDSPYRTESAAVAKFDDIHGRRVAETAAEIEAKPRALHEIAAEIRRTWKKKDGSPAVNYAAKPYLQAMAELTSITDMYYMDTAASVVRYFLANAQTWRGDDARRIKAELKAMLND